MKENENETDNAIVDGCMKNDRNSQKALYDKFSPEMLAVCMRYAQSKDEAEDIMIEGFMQVFTGLGSFKNNCSLKFWIRRIMINKAISNIRFNSKHYFQQPIDSETEEVLASDAGECDIETTLTGKEVILLIERMPEIYKLIFNLRIFEDYSFKEIGQELDIAESSARVYFLRARKWLEDIMDPKIKRL